MIDMTSGQQKFHRRKEGRNLPALARYRPSGDIAIVLTGPEWPTNTRTQDPDWTSHSLHVRSADPVARYREFGWKRTV